MRARFLPPTTWLALQLCTALSVSLPANAADAAKQSPEVRWAAEIRAFEKADQTSPPPRQAILFIGSSSIGRWTNLAEA